MQREGCSSGGNCKPARWTGGLGAAHAASHDRRASSLGSTGQQRRQAAHLMSMTEPKVERRWMFTSAGTCLVEILLARQQVGGGAECDPFGWPQARAPGRPRAQPLPARPLRLHPPLAQGRPLPESLVNCSGKYGSRTNSAKLGRERREGVGWGGGCEGGGAGRASV